MTNKQDGGWTTLSSRELFNSHWFNLQQNKVLLPAGQEITYTVVDHPGYAMVVPVLDDGRVLLENVYRYTVQETLLECPSGGLDGDTPLAAAHRELEEETGWVAKEMTLLGSFFGSTGISNEEFHLFLATGLSETGHIDREPSEQIELCYMPFDEAVKRVWNGEIKDSASAMALIWADRFLAKQRQVKN